MTYGQLCYSLNGMIFMPLPKTGSEGIMFCGHTSGVRPLTPISCDVKSLYLVEGIQRNLLQIFIM